MAVNDVDLWVLTAEAVLARGKTLADAIELADRVIAAYWRNAGRHHHLGLGGDTPPRPGLAKCAISAAPDLPRTTGSLPT